MNIVREDERNVRIVDMPIGEPFEREGRILCRVELYAKDLVRGYDPTEFALCQVLSSGSLVCQLLDETVTPLDGAYHVYGPKEV